MRHHNEAPVPLPPTNLVPIAASSQSKSKLRAFQYEEKDDKPNKKMEVANKENTRPTSEKTTPQMIPPPQPLSQRSENKDPRDCPQTPLGRLPLSELLASAEDTSRQHLNMTPMERVLWDNSPVDPNVGAAARRKRKRAHSSSPASSSQNETATHFVGAKPAVDLHTLQKALKTPKADPADDLWSRYSLSTELVDRKSPTAPGYPYLVQSSSPQTPATHLQRETGSLRRALSCIEWPTSVAKRRKLYNSSSQGNSTRDEGTIASVEKSKLSRVSLLVEKIHDGLSKPTTLPNDDTSSEPTASSPAGIGNKSPSSKSDLDLQQSQSAIDGVVNVLSQTAVAPRGNAPQSLVLTANEVTRVEQDGCSSNFDGEDLDLGMLETIDTKDDAMMTSVIARSATQEKQTGGTLVSAAVPGVKETREPGGSQGVRPAGSFQSDNFSDISFPSHVSSSTAKATPQNYDDFDEDEDEVSAAEIENMFAKYDSQLPQSHTKPEPRGGTNEAKIQVDKIGVSIPPKPKKATSIGTTAKVEVLSDDDSDEFGDDSDFEQIAVECEATQKQQVSQPQSSVCTLKTGSSYS